nr:SDR family oxidoreductase [Hyphomicrobium sp.]
MSKTGVLAGRSVIVTGANRGLGLAIAEEFARAGADLALGARDESLLATCAAELKRNHPAVNVVARRLDVSSPCDVGAFVDWAIEQNGKIDTLVNNAGVYGPMGSIETVDWNAWTDAVAINLFGSVLMARAVVPHMRRLQRGAIIQISGGGATNPMPGISAYAASKAAIVRFAETLAIEVKDDGITVNSLAPGALNTQLLDEVIAAGPEKVGKD